MANNYTPTELDYASKEGTVPTRRSFMPVVYFAALLALLAGLTLHAQAPAAKVPTPPVSAPVAANK